MSMWPGGFWAPELIQIPTEVVSGWCAATCAERYTMMHNVWVWHDVWHDVWGCLMMFGQVTFWSNCILLLVHSEIWQRGWIRLQSPVGWNSSDTEKTGWIQSTPGHISCAVPVLLVVPVPERTSGQALASIQSRRRGAMSFDLIPFNNFLTFLRVAGQPLSGISHHTLLYKHDPMISLSQSVLIRHK